MSDNRASNTLGQKFNLGDRVSYRNRLFRQTIPGGLAARGKSRKAWVEHSTYGTHEGIIVGERTLSNGDVEWGDYDNPTIFYPVEHLRAYMVVSKLREKPVYVLPESLAALGVFDHD